MGTLFLPAHQKDSTTVAKAQFQVEIRYSITYNATTFFATHFRSIHLLVLFTVMTILFRVLSAQAVEPCYSGFFFAATELAAAALAALAATALAAAALTANEPAAAALAAAAESRSRARATARHAA